jgi:cellulose synthase/poly-beta-1,6-N-acetylglucosamine synthase-like glycosyltransferase
MILPWLSSIYLLAAAGIALFGLLGLVTLVYYWRHRHETFPCPPIQDANLPQVTVQLPIYNERFVVGRLIDAAVQLDYPREKLQIQVIDDSTDDTTEIANAIVHKYLAHGVNIELFHRTHRNGYKAGALEDALKRATGDYIAVFDADFQPQSDFLRQTVPHFISEPDLGMVQTRWGHLNPFESQLTAAQTIALDKHFAMEQTVRHRASLFPKFNGSAGVWRRQCLLDAGGWEADTVCEDLCLSTRAILKGWQFRFLNEVVSPAELPTTISAYKNQQSRWAKGSTQCLVKFGPKILTNQKQSLIARIYALLSMSGYTTHLLLMILLLVQVPLIYLNYHPPPILLAFGLAGIAQPILFIMGQRELYVDWGNRIRYFPALLLVAIGLAPSNSRAIVQAVVVRQHTFIRTPKGGKTKWADLPTNTLSTGNYRLAVDWIVIIELLLAIYATIGLILCFWQGNFGPSFFMLSCALGFGYVALSTIRDHF